MTTSAYIGKCKAKGCRHALRTNYSDIQDLTTEQYKAGDFDRARGFMIYGVQPFGICPEHGAFVLKFMKGHLAPDHECDARCTGATGPNCDCACGGENHGMAHAA